MSNDPSRYSAQATTPAAPERTPEPEEMTEGAPGCPFCGRALDESTPAKPERDAAAEALREVGLCPITCGENLPCPVHDGVGRDVEALVRAIGAKHLDVYGVTETIPGGLANFAADFFYAGMSYGSEEREHRHEFKQADDPSVMVCVECGIGVLND